MIPKAYLDWMKEMIHNAQERKYEYLIARHKNARRYFYYDLNWIGIDSIDADPNASPYQLMWTPTQRIAYLFESEQEVEEFKADFVSPRKASIIRIIKPPHTMMELIG